MQTCNNRSELSKKNRTAGRCSRVSQKDKRDLGAQSGARDNSVRLYTHRSWVMFEGLQCR